MTDSSPTPPKDSQPERLAPDRRDFLAARALRDQLAEAVTRNSQSAESEPGPAPGLEPAEQWLQHFSHRAMAANFQVFLNLGQYPAAPARVLEGFSLVDQLEDRFSIFRSHSELSRVNLFASQTEVPVEADLFLLLELAEQLFVDTGGAFDIATTPLSRAWNFLSRAPRVPSAEVIATALRQSGQSHIVLNPETRSVRFRQPGVELNLHSLGKGFAVRRLAELLNEAGVSDFLIHGGQSSVLAGGDCLPVDPAGGGWRVGLTHPILPEQRLAEIRLLNQAIGTSGSARQGLVHQGQRLGHILDPRTGWPASHWLSTTVLHSDPTLADALATAFFVMSEEEICTYCEYHPEVSAINFRQLGSSSRMELRLFRYSKDVLELNPAFNYLSPQEVLPASATPGPKSGSTEPPSP